MALALGSKIAVAGDEIEALRAELDKMKKNR